MLQHKLRIFEEKNLRNIIENNVFGYVGKRIIRQIVHLFRWLAAKCKAYKK